MSKMGQYVFEMQEYGEQLIANDIGYGKARQLFEDRYKGAGWMFDQLYRECTGIEPQDGEQ